MTLNMKVNFHFENIPTIFRQALIDDYVEGRSKVCEIFNIKIGAINEEWDKVGEPAAFGKYAEDINPKYSEFVNSYFTEDLKIINKGRLVKMKLDEYSDIVGYLPMFPGSKIYVTLEPIK